MKNMFTDSFERINANFKKIFTELFGGGQCELILTDPNNVLECGIEINVQPPGKVITILCPFQAESRLWWLLQFILQS